MRNKKKGTIISVGSGSKKKIVSGTDTVIKIQGKPIKHDSVGQVDLVFVIDTTGSMSNKIDGLLATCIKFVDEFSELNLDHRIAVVAFGDLTVPGDKIVATRFTNKTKVTQESLEHIPRYGGGGNEGESSLEALDKALTLSFRSQAVNVVILITDEPALQHNIRAEDMVERLTRQEILAFVVSPPLAYFKDMAIKNGGKWYKVAVDTDFTDLMDMFKEVANEVSQVVSDVHRLGNGSVSRYLQLSPPEK